MHPSSVRIVVVRTCHLRVGVVDTCARVDAPVLDQLFALWADSQCRARADDSFAVRTRMERRTRAFASRGIRACACGRGCARARSGPRRGGEMSWDELLLLLLSASLPKCVRAIACHRERLRSRSRFSRFTADGE